MCPKLTSRETRPQTSSGILVSWLVARFSSTMLVHVPKSNGRDVNWLSWGKQWHAFISNIDDNSDDQHKESAVQEVEQTSALFQLCYLAPGLHVYIGYLNSNAIETDIHWGTSWSYFLRVCVYNFCLAKGRYRLQCKCCSEQFSQYSSTLNGIYVNAHKDMSLLVNVQLQDSSTSWHFTMLNNSSCSKKSGSTIPDLYLL